jgi:hypothetical protein
MLLNGWVIAKDIDSKKSRVYVVLKSDSETYLYNTKSQLREDVGDYFKSYNYNNSGFYCAASKKELKPGIYRVGLIVHTDEQIFFQLMDKKIAVHFPVATNTDLANLVTDYQKELKYNIDSLKQMENHLYIRGWAFLREIESANTSIRLILKSENESIPLWILQEARKDVTAYFAPQPNSKNYDASGFILNAILRLPPKKYKILIAILQENGIEYIVDTNKEIHIQ